MTLPYIGNHTHIGACHFTESVHLSKITDAHLYHCHLMLRTYPKQGQGHPDFIVIIPFCLQHPVFLCQDTGNKFFGTCLSHTAGNAYHGDSDFSAIELCDILQGLKCILNDTITSPVHTLCPGFHRQLFRCLLRNSKHGSCRKSLTDKLMSIHTFTNGSQENATRFHLSRINYHRADAFIIFCSISTCQLSATGLSNLPNGQIQSFVPAFRFFSDMSPCSQCTGQNPLAEFLKINSHNSSLLWQE